MSTIVLKDPPKASECHWSGATAADNARWKAVLARDPESDGLFVYGVMTTGVFCRPSCPSRRPLQKNVRFNSLHAEARADGLRPCLRCRPEEASTRQKRSLLVEAACRRIEENDPALRIGALAGELNVSPYHFQRIFKDQTGLTPKAYQSAVRRKAAEAELGRGAPVTEAIHASGYATASRFYDGVGATLGMAPGAARRGGLGEVIRYVHADTSLGRMIVGFSAAGVCAVQFGEDDAALVKEVSRRFPRACLEPAHDTALPVQHIVDIVDGKTKGEDLPLDIRGTAFQARVWAALRAIPSGQTASYAEIAERIGKPSATRAVAQACGANHIAVLVPCHRVVRADGGLAGYRWGVARKRNLLGREGARAIEETSR